MSFSGDQGLVGHAAVQSRRQCDPSDQDRFEGRPGRQRHVHSATSLEASRSSIALRRGSESAGTKCSPEFKLPLRFARVRSFLDNATFSIGLFVGCLVQCFTVPGGLYGQEPVDGESPIVQASLAPQYYFAIRVQSVDSVTEWYQSILGVEPLDERKAEDGRWRIVNLRSEHFAIEIVEDSRSQATPRPFGLFKVGFAVDDVDAIARRVAELTGELPTIVDFPPHEIRILQLEDPEGNVLQLFSPLVGSASRD